MTALARSGFEAPERPYPQLTYDPQSARRHYRARPAIVAARALEIGWKSAGFGAAIARDYLKGADFMASNAPRRAEQLTALLTELGPTFIKLGQVRASPDPTLTLTLALTLALAQTLTLALTLAPAPALTLAPAPALALAPTLSLSRARRSAPTCCRPTTAPGCRSCRIRCSPGPSPAPTSSLNPN